MFDKKLNLGSFIVAMLASNMSNAGLINTNLSIETLYQPTSASAATTIGLLTTVNVTDPGVEFPSLEDTAITNSLGFTVVDVAIDAGDNFLTIDFDHSGPYTQFANGFFNGYVFTFENSSAVTFTGATIDPSVTTLGLTQSDLSFSGNKLFVNVESLAFNASTFARINLTSTGGPSPVPVPAALWLFGSGVLGLAGIKSRIGHRRP